METLNTPFGAINRVLALELQEIAGYRITNTGVLSQYNLIVDPVDCFCRNTRDERRSNEDDLSKRIANIPIRYFNFLYALWKTGWNFPKAKKYVQEKLYNLDGSPVYLPEKLSPMDNGRSQTYGKIVKECEDLMREATLSFYS